MGMGLIYPVIMCGGAGTRLWPTSRGAKPKQFQKFGADKTLFAAAIERVSLLASLARLVVVAGEDHARAVLADLRTLGVEADVLLEPQARDSAAAIAAATAWVQRLDPNGVMVIVASDHHIPDAQDFRDAINACIPAAREGAIVTLGVRPTEASSAYGYIRPGASQESGIAAVAEFKEKPAPDIAASYVAEGYLWNSGNFVATAATFLDELRAFEPEIADAGLAAVDNAQPAIGVWRLGDAFRAAPRKSIDFAVMERTNRARVLPVTFAWSDLGAWDAIHAITQHDEQANALLGQALVQSGQGNLILAANGVAVAVSGARDLAIIAERDAILVADLTQAQAVKSLVEHMRRSNWPQANGAPDGYASLTTARENLRNWLFYSALPFWASMGVDRGFGGFVEALDLDGAAPPTRRRMRVQPRQSFVFGRAGAMGWAGPWRVAIEIGFAGLAHRFARGDGLYRTLVDTDGQALDEVAYLYDHAFVLLALAWSSGVMDNAEAKALSLLDQLTETFTHDRGGFCEVHEAFLSNPHMHLLEAAMAWVENGASPRWRGLAGNLARLALEQLIDPQSGAIGEHYSADWSPSPGPAGALLEPGHQFEWAWLLARWARLGSDEAALHAARRLFAAGERGFDPARGVIVMQIDKSNLVIDPIARLWPQTEWLKAALILMEESRDADERCFYEKQALAAVNAVDAFLLKDRPGLWRDKMTTDGGFVEEPAPASTLYHLIEAIRQLMASV